MLQERRGAQNNGPVVCPNKRICGRHAVLSSNAHLKRLDPLSLEEQVPTLIGWMSSRAVAVAGSMAI